MVHKPYTPRNDFNFTRTGKELFHEYTAPLCIVMPKLQHRYRAEGLLSICLGIMPPCSFFAAFKALVPVLFGHYRVSSRCRFLRGSDQLNLDTITGALLLQYTVSRIVSLFFCRRRLSFQFHFLLLARSISRHSVPRWLNSGRRL